MIDGSGIRIRPARYEDVPAIVRMLADDPIGSAREGLTEPLSEQYRRAFDLIAEDTRNLLVVAEADEGSVVGCLHLTFIPGLSYRGAERALIEDVRVDVRYRRRKIGGRLIEWAIEAARARPCCLVQLFVHEARADALRFYKDIGFKDSHSGMRLMLTDRVAGTAI